MLLKAIMQAHHSVMGSMMGNMEKMIGSAGLGDMMKFPDMKNIEGEIAKMGSKGGGNTFYMASSSSSSVHLFPHRFKLKFTLLCGCTCSMTKTASLCIAGAWNTGKLDQTGYVAYFPTAISKVSNSM